MINIRLSLASALLCSIFTHSLYSDEATDNDEILIITHTRNETSSESKIGNIDKITSEEIDSVGHHHIQELLTRVPGVNLQRGNGQESLPAIRSPVMTGAGGCGGFLMTEDNIPLRAAGFCNINELFEAHTEQAQSIEVIRGPASAYFGSNALHGVINVITPDVPANQRKMLGFETGSNDFARFKSSYGDADQAINLALTIDHDGGYRDESGYEQQKLTARHFSQTGSLTINSGFTLTNLEQETAGYIEGLNSYLDDALARSNANPEAYRNANSLRIWSQFDYQLANSNQFIITPYIRKTDMTFMQHFLPGKPVEENGQESLGIQSSYYYSTNGIELSIGLDAEFSQGFLKQTQAQATAGSAFLQATIPVGKHYDYQVDALQMAPFIHIDWQLSEHWQMTAGLRYEYMSYDYNNLMLAGRTRDDGSECGFGGCRYSRPEDSKNTFNNVSPKIGLSYLTSDKSLFFLNIARGFRAPQATELYRLQRDQIIADLDSVEVDSYEIGMRKKTQLFDYELVFYQMAKENIIYRDSDFFNLSNGKTQHQGLEARINYAINDELHLAINGSLTKHQYRHDQFLGEINIKGNEVDTAPRHFGSVQLDWKLSSDLSLELEWLHQGGYYTDPENLHQYGGHNLINLRTNWNFGNNWQLFARINNLTDKRYAERADYTFFTDERYFPGIPLSIFVGAQWRGGW